tara:strand:+ start:34318 stop:34683 length:366 start_codon:yes stop_codon:yes gene_type:complete
MAFLVPFHGGFMIIQCPKCQSIRASTLHNGRRVCGSVGTAAGAASGVAAATSGARVGMTLGYVAGPGGSLLGGIAGAVIGGLIGGVAGGEAGAALGDKLDQTFLDNLQCLDCGHDFRLDTD